MNQLSKTINYDPGRLRVGVTMENTLKHYGVKGMRWGVRRNRRQGASRPTRRGISEKSMTRGRNAAMVGASMVKESKNINSAVSNIRSRRKPDLDLSSMTDKELKDRVARLNLENQYKTLSGNKKQMSEGQAMVSDVLDIAGSSLALVGSSLAIAIAIKQLKDGK